ncbi:hypothetical protein Z517_12050 [Fonsecaea pedrosoi CBS 271.37]|uniref:Unplaced genomic scaffold supercont1.8, whole genome shotgun sequence n=1 Tax=Fonsecaea pedrosoi CBS 271.37 TaxID=1442368 RepID=A0A0D2DCC0_9EURO|nr:uncharacterized protein Z517_12050 [Fonsecaea pedrosoi CBS 271.37]KIW75276.1 hypothetical protein Z517_12050 [Fonsecaea pedrosoi CBS 271.37]
MPSVADVTPDPKVLSAARMNAGFDKEAAFAAIAPGAKSMAGGYSVGALKKMLWIVWSEGT